MRIILLYINTIKYLKVSQVINRLIRKFFFLKKIPKYKKSKYQRSEYWVQHFTSTDKLHLDPEIRTSFLNKEIKIQLPFEWNNEKHSKLWLYNLHYFDWFSHQEAKEKFHLINKIFDNWIENNQYGRGLGWEPYPTSLRLVNLIKAFLNGNDYSENQYKSIFLQLYHLKNNLEHHLLGNHYFSNIKALLFGGVLFNDRELIEFSSKELIYQLKEQILEDGAHFELSMMYHNIILYDLLDIYNLFRSHENKFDQSIESILRNNIKKMIKYMESMLHTDGDIPFFNDSTLNVAPHPEAIYEYSKLLNIKADYFDRNLIDHIDSGFIVSYKNKTKLIFNCSQIKADYIPGHYHASMLSFEMSFNEKRFFVNSGINTYENNNKRHKQRGTISQNTVEVNSENSIEVWSSFRVARRALINNKESLINNNQNILSATHDGYSRLIFNSQILHHRQIIHEDNSLTIMDRILGEHHQAVSRIHLHPDVVLNYSEDNKILFLSNNKDLIQLDIEHIDLTVDTTSWFDGFNIKHKNSCLVFNVHKNKLDLSFYWD
tara:strand:+ start:155 stop:1789 length:1635 start_codon:yes stop_codon:yes gene_type:complete